MTKTDFECVVCGVDKSEALPRWVGDDGSRICDECAEECVAPQFYDALQHEHHYPPMFGHVVLDLWTYWDLFDRDFLTAWGKKMQEYNVPVKSRVYCEQRGGVDGDVCGAYLGTKGPGFVCCSLCHCSTCKKCGASSGDVGSAKTHHCQAVLKEDPFEKLIKGRDYQQCPGCKKEIVQGEGCNHMVCLPPCTTHFCFFCGEQVIARRSGHWQKGHCPRFGVEGKNLIWDNEGEHSDADSEEDESDEFQEAETADDEEDRPVPDFPQRIQIQRLIGIFDHARDAEQHEDTRHRTMIAPMIRRESRANFFSYMSHNLALADQVRLDRFPSEDAANILREFRDRHQHIIRQLQRYRSDPRGDWVGSGVTDLADLEDELDSYKFYVGETIGDLRHTVQQETERTARGGLNRRA
jgi:hypothetical protein